MAGVSAGEQKQVIGAVKQKIASFPTDHPPVEMAADIHELVRCLAGADDPYASIKRESNEICRSCLPLLHENLAWSLDPISTAVRLAIAGNVIDFGAYAVKPLSRRDVRQTVEDVLSQPLSGDSPDALAAVADEATTILFIGDNAGECFFDRLLLERLPAYKLTYAVRGGPVLNDATLDDARAAGIEDVCPVIDTGDKSPGVVFNRCSPAFREALEASDLVIAKGQGNYESLSGRTDRAYVFITKVKCDVIADDIGFPTGSNVVQITQPQIKRRETMSAENSRRKMEVSYA
jgi:damage-control phosphatase, subfamily I